MSKNTGSLSYLEQELPLVEVDCAMCGSTDSEICVSAPPFYVKRCLNCAFVYVSPRVPDSHLQQIYEGPYFASQDPSHYGYADYVQEESVHHKTFKKKANFLRGRVQTGDLLEIGSGHGFFLTAMKAQGFKVEGVEVSAAACQYARSNLNLSNIH